MEKTMTKEEKRQLLIEFRKFYYKGPMYFPITDGTIDLFLSTLPDEGGKDDEDVERLAKEVIDGIEEGDIILSEQNKLFIKRCIKAGYKAGKQSNPK